MTFQASTTVRPSRSWRAPFLIIGSVITAVSIALFGVGSAVGLSDTVQIETTEITEPFNSIQLSSLYQNVTVRASGTGTPRVLIPSVSKPLLHSQPLKQHRVEVVSGVLLVEIAEIDGVQFSFDWLQPSQNQIIIDLGDRVAPLNSVDLNTASGDIEIALSSAADVTVQSIQAKSLSGSIRLQVPTGQEFNIHTSTRSGTVSTTLSPNLNAPNRITAETSSGDITLRN